MMKYRRLGKTGLEVSEVGFGGEWLERHSDEECVRLLDVAGGAGINILDCWMSNPDVRRKIGLALKGRRERWHVQGHIGSIWRDGQYVRSRDLWESREAFQDLLRLLDTDYIDLGMIHYVDEERELESILGSDYLKYVQDLKAAGTIRHIGMSTHNPRIGRLAVEEGLVEMMLFSINPAFDLMPPTEDINEYFADELASKFGRLNPERSEFYSLCEQKGIGLTVMKPFAGGRLFDPARSPFGVALTVLQCLHYALTRPAVASVLAGYDTPEQVLEAAAYSDAQDEAKDYASTLADARYGSYEGQCTYCGHCSPCPRRIDIAMVNKLHDLASMQSDIPGSILEHYRNLSAKADDCIGCRACEKRCPFGVPIAARMKETARLFARA